MSTIIHKPSAFVPMEHFLSNPEKILDLSGGHVVVIIRDNEPLFALNEISDPNDLLRLRREVLSIQCRAERVEWFRSNGLDLEEAIEKALVND